MTETNHSRAIAVLAMLFFRPNVMAPFEISQPKDKGSRPSAAVVATFLGLGFDFPAEKKFGSGISFYFSWRLNLSATEHV